MIPHHEKRRETLPGQTRSDLRIRKTGYLRLHRHSPHSRRKNADLAERLRHADIGIIYSSDLQRSSLGAQIIARDHDAEVFQLPELRELNFGTWEGLSLTELTEQFPEEAAKRKADILNFQIPEGETLVSFSKRITTCLNSILASNHERDILIVAHKGVNRVILCHLLELDLSKVFVFQQDYGCLNVIDFFPDNTKVIKLING
jgi:alpha-ribazole phosphatase